CGPPTRRPVSPTGLLTSKLRRTTIAVLPRDRHFGCPEAPKKSSWLERRPTFSRNSSDLQFNDERRGRMSLFSRLSAHRATAALGAAVSLIVALITLAGASSLTQPASATVADAPAGWTTVFSDDFSGAAGSGIGSNWA